MYLLCRFYDFDDVRITALHRFEKVELLDEPIRLFPEFNIDDYLNTGVMQWALPDPKLISLELRVNQWLKNHLEESPLSEQQLLVIDDEQQESYLVKAEMLDGRQLRRWLLSLGSDVEVIAPKGLCDWMASIVKAQADRYLE
ncbi:hypothetical protein GCM10007878_02100 [Marinospirillum insulare]|uniref:WCX domain-containing protein n=1 Tax=Marinospirillum insulare TaxID=217169 RepID=A0ABQ5ZUP3_9GAMM|nr:hypothetical protein GCM10007878_02100 [Marinospirillum insulare]